MKALIVDDEPLARARLKRLLTEHPTIQAIAEASNAEEALVAFNKQQPAIVFLDIEMPGMDGLTLAEHFNQQTPSPAIILVTAHPEHALEAYRVGPVDYLLKPVDPNRLQATLTRLESRPTNQSPQNKADWISFKKGDSYQRIAFSDILYFSAEENSVKVVYRQGEAYIEDTLKHLASTYPFETVRIHRHLLINKHKLVSLSKKDKGHFVTLKDCETQLPVSRRKIHEVKEIIHAQN